MDGNFGKLTDRQKLEIIFKYTNQVNKASDIDSTLLILANMGRDIVAAERCSLWLIDSTGKKLYTQVAHGVEKIEIDINYGVVGACIRENKTLVINDPYNDDRFHSDVDLQTGFVTKSILVEPLVDTKGKVIGAIQVLNKKSIDGKFSDEDSEMLVVAAGFSANSLETFMLNLEITESQNETILMLGEICEKRSLETGKHTARVAKYSAAIAGALGLPKEEIQILRQASGLHDIGKMAIVDKILLKPGKLTKEEYDEMKKHSNIGYNMLKDSRNRILQAGALISHEHHEKFNGTGYPQGLKGEEIHVFARITAIADVFDAITSVRCYKEAWPIAKSFELIRKESGEHFDPKVVDAFFEVQDEILEIFADLKEVKEVKFK